MFSRNFCEFINGYRIEESKRQLFDPARQERSILDIAYEVGFNSKSTFNSAFKKHTGPKPSEFRAVRSALSSSGSGWLRHASRQEPAYSAEKRCEGVEKVHSSINR